MATKFSWILFLNEACTWETKEQAQSFLGEAAGCAIEMTTTEVSQLSKLESYMREQIACLHFKRPLDFSYLNERLSNIHMQLHPTSSRQVANSMVLPTLAADAHSNEPLATVIDTLIAQFAFFLGDTVDGGATYTVSRCEAICKKKAVEDCSLFYKKFRSLEDNWKSEITSDLQNLDEVERCADFFIANPGAKFCSDVCRFNSFALRKQLKSPSYQAEKQKRYRARQKAESEKGQPST
jgi:hypothetical protein